MLSVVFIILFTLTLAFGQVNVFNLSFNQSYYHDNMSFTQGLFIEEGKVWESSGGYGKSFIRQWNLESAEVLAELKVDPEIFIEGITSCAGKYYALTWKSGQVFEFDSLLTELKPIWNIKGEGWGASCYQNNLITSDGSSLLKKINPINGDVLATIDINKNQSILNTEKHKGLNELEVIDDYLLINLWYKNHILIFDLKKNKLIEKWDFSKVLSSIPNNEKSKMDSMNGIAWDSQNNKLFLTGKLWFQVYELEIPNGSLLKTINFKSNN